MEARAEIRRDARENFRVYARKAKQEGRSQTRRKALHRRSYFVSCARMERLRKSPCAHGRNAFPFRRERGFRCARFAARSDYAENARPQESRSRGNTAGRVGRKRFQGWRNQMSAKKIPTPRAFPPPPLRSRERINRPARTFHFAESSPRATRRAGTRRRTRKRPPDTPAPPARRHTFAALAGV